MERKINPNLINLARLTHNPNLELPNLDEVSNENQTQPHLLQVKANINLSDYVQIPNSNILIPKYEQDEFKGFNYKDTHKKVLENRLFMPTPALFMPYFKSVVDAYNEKINLYDGTGNQLQKKEIEDIYKHLTIDHINGGAYSWLNSKFKNENNKWSVETVEGIDNKGNLIIKSSPLESCLRKDCFVELKFNSQGLAVEKSKKQKYLQGENVYYWYPRDGAVARFGAGSDRADLNCLRDPDYSDSSLGIAHLSVIGLVEIMASRATLISNMQNKNENLH